MISLFLDTSSKKLEVILIKDNEILSKKELESINDHASHLVPFIDEILKDNDLTTKDINKTFVVNGPGSFTGTRIGVTVGKTLAYSNNTKVIPVSSLKQYIFGNTGYDYYVVGSDQVWNPHHGKLKDLDLLVGIPDSKRISYAASIGIDELPESVKDKAKEEWLKFKAISVREDKGKEIIEELTGRNDVQVNLDPTMLLTSEEWSKLAKRPKQLKTDKYILNYFLGELSEQRKNEIERIAKENDCEIINILDKNGEFYETGPSEFLYLEQNAFLICTDSFHSSVFSILFNRPFIVFNREDINKSMNSRIDTLINTFKLTNRNYEGKITADNLNHDYSEAFKILDSKRMEAKEYLRNALGE
jgi:tRNA threonylcarbamoyl adenosine modification protein YeaZ